MVEIIDLQCHEGVFENSRTRHSILPLITLTNPRHYYSQPSSKDRIVLLFHLFNTPVHVCFFFHWGLSTTAGSLCSFPVLFFGSLLATPKFPQSLSIPHQI